MEAILRELDEENAGTKFPPLSSREAAMYSTENLAQALSRLAQAMRNVAPLLQQQRLEGDSTESKTDDNGIVNAEWLMKVLQPISSDLGVSQLARLVVEASQPPNSPQQQEEALFATLGASEEAMTALFEIFPRMTEIQQNISLKDLGFHDDSLLPTMTYIDHAEVERQKLRQEVIDTAQVAALAQAEVDSLLASQLSGPGGGATHTIARKSEMELQKAAKKAQKRAAQALQRAKDAGAILEEGDLLAVNPEAGTMGEGGLLGRSHDELLALQQALLPEGSRKYYNEQGLPSGTVREDDDEIGYEKVTIPPPVLDASQLHPRLRIEDIMDEECARAFAGTTSLNPMQSAVFDTAFHRRENMLVCAPTGAGKTNVAMLTVTAHFRDVGLIRSYENDGDDSNSALETGQKVVYIAPMKALAQEVVEKFSSKLKPLGLIVRELTGDMQLTRAEAESANVIVTTPEKWDVVTRKSGNDDNSLGNKCGLLIIDEVHLLADDRGSVIESVVARSHRLVESRQKQQRIVGLSATLPNYQDVAEFLQVPERGLFYFGPEHRPVPLQQTFVGVTGNVKDRSLMERKMNDVCYNIVKDSLRRGYQVMVFVHSRKGTSDAATALAQRASAASELDRYFVTQGKEGAPGEAYKRYVDRVMKSRNREVTNHFYNGMGIHHAGMLRGDRKLTESMFADGAIKVLCTTATLAWGINLPAHTVVVKGTDIYNPEKGKMVDLSILDVQQIFGRAGRPQFDTSGEANLITNHAALNRYLDKLVRAVPIESTFTKQLADHLNAEIVGGTVTNLNEAATWLSYTYLYVRMLKNPLAYGISADKKVDDPMLRGKLLELVREAATTLSHEMMVSFDPRSGNLSMTTLGRVAAHFYIQAESVATFNETMHLKPLPTDSDLMRMVCSANEFENLRVRQEEQSELDDLQAKCPLPLEGPVNDASTKTYVLLQAFISRQRPKSFTLISDTNYIASNAGRVARAIFEMCLHSDKAGTALKLLRIAKSIDNQFWWFQTPLRFFESELGINVIKAIESRHHSGRSTGYDSMASALSLLDMTPEEVGQLVRSKKAAGTKVQRFVGMIPKPHVEYRVQPVTRDVLRFQIDLTPDFEWQGRWHGGAVFFWLWIENSQSDRIYHQEQVVFTKKSFSESLNLEIFVPTFQGTSTQYLLRLVSDTWVGVEVVYPISLEETRMPEQHPVNTDLIDLTPLPTTALQDEKYEQLFSKIETFNPVQTQLFHVLYHTDYPVLLGAPTGSGKTVCGELPILRMKRVHKEGICVYIAPLKSLARERLKEWTSRFGGTPLHWKVLELSGDTHHDRGALDRADILICTPEKFDLLSRNWRGGAKDKKQSFVQRVRLLVIDEIHLLGEERGAVLEAIVSRMRFISRSLQEQTQNHQQSELVRIVGLSTAVANPLDLADWIGIRIDGADPAIRRGLYNFRPSIRPVPTVVHVQGYPGKHYCPRMATMNKPCYASIKQYAPDRPSLIFVASRRQTRLTAFDLISFAARDENPKAFLGCDDAYIDAIAASVQDEALRHTITFGIGLHHAGLSSRDRDIVERLYLSGEIRVLVATATLAWGVNLPARLVIVKGTEYFDAKTSRYVDYPLTDCLQMIGRAGRPGFDTEGTAVVLVESSKKTFYKKFLYTPFPVESCLRGRLCENLNAEIASGTVNTLLDAIGYLSWTFFARRVKANPSYYGAKSSKAEDVDALLSEIATETLVTLKEQGCIDCELSENDVISPTVLGRATCDYYLNHKTAKQMNFGLRECSKMILLERATKPSAGDQCTKLHAFVRRQRLEDVSIAWLLYCLCSTHEFDELPVRHNEEFLNEELSESVMWGADTSGILSLDGRRGYIDSEVYADPHTKAFLLIQAFLQKQKLPISDYVNDTKTVMDSVPRLLAAMQFISSHAIHIDGSFEVACQIVRTKQLITSRSTTRSHPATQIPGMNYTSFKELLQKSSLPIGSTLEDDVTGSLWTVRQAARDDVAEAMKKCKKGTFKASFQVVLDSLYAMPSVFLSSCKIYHEIDKVSGKSKGTLKVSLTIDFPRSKHPLKDNFATLVLVLGSFNNQRLLGHLEIPMAQQWQRTMEKELQFDWKAANEDGGEDGGHVVLRLLVDSVRGLDSEIVIQLS
ncbi:DEAD/DEAH box helicase domain protein [Nitzschia inconspicua]|uniref:U5 small nuclear ribonucleoprotein 200 kDa helicase n=1 Tax=Nitzschia inconspicua TaxID=303405 RepID=A0A9K3LJX7_9STRA|nr:DEAD/DEAH box helicase domain protein [Nitzschia inconspicua]